MPLPYSSTVTSAASSYDLTVLATVKEELGITDSSSDDLLSRLITEQSAVAATYCRRVFAQETIVDSFRLPCFSCDPIILSRRPVASITSIVEDGTTLDAADYEFDATTGFVWRLDDDERISWPAVKAVVTFVAGYELLTTLPRDIERAVLALIKRTAFGRTRDPMAKAEEVAGIGRTEYWVGNVPGSNGMPAEAVALLDPHREVTI